MEMPNLDPQVFTSLQCDASTGVYAWAGMDSARAAQVGRALSQHYRCQWGVSSYEDARDSDINVQVRWDIESAYDLGVDDQGRLLLLMVTTSRYGTAWNRRRLTQVRFTSDIERDAL